MHSGISEQARLAAEKVDEARLWQSLMEMAKIGARPDGGVQRHALSPEDLEALIAMEEAGVETRRPVDLVAWTNEEGGRFERSCTGSSVWAGSSELESYLGDIGADGVPPGEALAATLAATPDLPRRPRRWPAHAYVEAHSEQGPVLEREGVPIAAVTGIQGVRWMNIEVLGKGSHAGTTPLKVRRDAVQAAVRAIDRLNELMADPED